MVRNLFFGMWLGLGLMGCKPDLTAFFIHESVNTRWEESQRLLPHYGNNLFHDTANLEFAVFSDIHITESNDNLFGDIRDDVAQNGLDFVIVAGDLTDNGLPVEYENCISDFEDFDVPWFVTIGNHDLYQNDGWESYKAHFGPSAYSIRINAALRLLFLDTSTGTVGKKQFIWLEEQLNSAEEKNILVITHYPLYDDLVPSIWRLPSSEERYNIIHLLQKYQVSGFIGGHLHTFQHLQFQEIDHFIVGSMYPHALDKGPHGYLRYSLRNGMLFWEQVQIPD